MKVFIFDAAKCNGCHACQVACKDEHCGNNWMPYAVPQPEDTGMFWYRLNEFVRGTIPQVKVAYVPTLCMHCDEAPCIDACDNEAIYKREDGLVIIDPAKCTGAQLCMDACPYGGVISFNQDLKVAQKCTGCAHLLDRGWPIDQPRCVDACVTGALIYGEESDLQDAIADAEVLVPKVGDAPQVRVYYKNLPKRFVAGTVYDPVEEEVVIGATCTLSGDGSATATTDEFGDFWFEGLDVGNYTLKIEASGLPTVEVDVSTEEDVSLGDLAMA